MVDVISCRIRCHQKKHLLLHYLLLVSRARMRSSHMIAREFSVVQPVFGGESLGHFSVDATDLQIKGERNKNHENRRKTSLENKTQEFAKSVSDVLKDRKDGLPKKQTSTVKPIKPSGGHSEPGRPMKPTFGQKLNNDEVKCCMTLSSRTIYHIRTSKILNLPWNKSDIQNRVHSVIDKFAEEGFDLLQSLTRKYQKVQKTVLVALENVLVFSLSLIHHVMTMLK